MENHLGGCIIQGDLATWGPEVWGYLIDKYNIKSVVDVGCGAGHSLKYFLDKGLNSIGVEGYEPAIEASNVKNFIKKHDFTKDKFITDTNHDMVWCCEFVEHVEEKYVDNFLDLFSKSKLIAMTHGLPGQPGFHHVNCQPQEYWVNKLTEKGFTFKEEESIKLRDMLPTYKYVDGVFFNEQGGKEFNNTINPHFPHGGHIKTSLLIFLK
jgi:hypothetical protein